jgi:rhamnogalacturonyl hydrolase YesR
MTKWTAAALTIMALPVLAQQSPGEKPLDPREVEATIRRVGDWTLHNPEPFHPLHWAMAPLYDGLIDASLVTGDPKYLAAVMRAGRLVDWQPGPNTYHADDHAAGHPFLRLFLMSPRERERLQPWEERFDEILKNPISETLSFTENPKTPGMRRTDRWTWSDALYMAPPTLALLTKATGDERYMRWADGEFKATFEALFDKEENLFYRDARYIGQRTPSGEKVFWSRGNAWVYAGLTYVLDVLPAGWPNRDFYVDIFKAMSPAVLETQQRDGFWYPSLKDPKHVPTTETSGSALFVLGLAWGVREGILDKATYWPAVERGWRAIQSKITPEGAVTFVQPVGAAPEPFDPASRVAYGTGAVLMAGAEILRGLGAAANPEPRKLAASAGELVPQALDLSRPRTSGSASAGPSAAPSGAQNRAYLVRVLTRIAEPVLEAMAKGELKKRMPIHDWEKDRSAWTHYEAFARTLAGIAPWLELGPDDTPEGKERERFIGLARRSLINGTDPASPDYLNFGQVPDQPLVESAYLAAALMSAPKQLWEPLSATQKRNVVSALRTSLAIPFKHNNNWYLFPAMIEAFLWQAGELKEPERLVLGVKTLEGWYLGDGTYGDGPHFHWDYYNSYVIHPMLLQPLKVAQAKNHPIAKSLPLARERAHRYAEILERLISPEGTFPVMGRSSAYRFAAFYHLAYMALTKDLPGSLDAGAVRAAITAVVRSQIEAPGTFDKEGWLRLGAVGYQPGIEETYNATGSLYVCLTGLVHLGLPPDDPFWTARATDWTQKKIWSGQDVPRDHALSSSSKTQPK